MPVSNQSFLYRKAADRITEYYDGLMSANCKPLTMGGDHFVSYPILRAIAAKHGPVGIPKGELFQENLLISVETPKFGLGAASILRLLFLI